jgi:hypothetical protein
LTARPAKPKLAHFAGVAALKTPTVQKSRILKLERNITLWVPGAKKFT